MIHNHGPEDGGGLSCNELRLLDGSRIGACLIKEMNHMAHTGHGHHIPNSPLGTIQDTPKNPARCGGVNICPRCKQDVEDYNAIMIGEEADYQAKAKQMVMDYVDALHKQNFPLTELQTYTVYVVWFSKTLQNWKAVLGTTLADGRLFELTHNGDDKVTYFDCYTKTDNFPIHDRG